MSFLLLLAAGCGADGGEDLGPHLSAGEELALMREMGTVVELPESDEYTDKAKPYIDLVATAKHYSSTTHVGPNRSQYACFLTGVAGYFDGWQGYGLPKTCLDDDPWAPEEHYDICDFDVGSPMFRGVSLLTNGEGVWSLRSIDDTRGRARCVPHLNFRADSGAVAWMANDWSQYGVSWKGNSDMNKTRTLWQGDAASFLSTVGGNWDGFGEKAWIVQSTTGAGYNQLRVRSDDGDLLEEAGVLVRARSYFVGNPGDYELVNLWGYDTSGNHRRGTVNSSGTYEMAVGDSTGFSGFWLTHKDNAICYLTYVAGNWNGFSEKIRVIEKNGYWFLEAKSDGGAVRGKARCMAYDQRG